MRNGFSINIVEVLEQNEHRHPELEMIYVMDGSLSLECDNHNYFIKKEDIFLVNSDAVHRNVHSEQFVAAVISIDYRKICEVLQNTQILFDVNTALDVGRTHYNLRENVRKMIYYYLIHCNEFKMCSVLYAILDVLSSEYLVVKDISEKASDGKMNEIIRFINQNYNEELPMDKLCQDFYITKSTFMRGIKKKTGMNFIEYVNNLRTHYAAMDLLYSEKSVTRISEEQGFSSLAAFNKTFKKVYSMSAMKYRKEYRERNLFREPLSNVCDEYIEEFAKGPQPETNVLHKSVDLNMAKYKPFNNVWKKAVCGGTVEQMLSAKLQKQILEYKSETGFSYVKVTNVLAPSMKMLRNGKNIKLNYQKIDEVIDFLMSNGLMPILELGYGNSTKDIVESQSYQSRHEYESCVRELVRHLVVRYGTEKIGNWIFDIRFACGMEKEEEYLKSFDTIAAMLRRWFPLCKVGGFGHRLGMPMPQMICRWQDMLEKPDFISFSAYPYYVTETDAGLMYERSRSEDYIKNEIQKVKQTLRKCKLEDIPLYLTSWNLSVSDKNMVNDSYGKGASALRLMIELMDDIELGCYDTFSDLNVADGEHERSFFGGRGMINKDGLKKPILFAVGSLAFANDYLIDKGKNYILTTNGKNSFHLLCFNDKMHNYDYYKCKEDEIGVKELETIYVNDEHLKMSFCMKGMEDGAYRVKYARYKEENSALECWERMGAMKDFDVDDHRYLKEIIRADIRLDDAVAKNGEMCIETELKAHEVLVVYFYQTA